MSKYLFLLSSALICAPLSAQDETAGTSDERIVISDLRILPSTITVTGMSTDLKSSGASVTVIDEEEIESVQGGDITRVLARSPGLAISRNGPLGAFTGVRLRGGESEQLLVLVDGVRVADPAAPSGGFDFGTLSTGNLAKIEIYRGSNSTIWGTDAIAGVMAVSSRLQTDAKASVEYGARDTLFANATGGLEGDGWFAGLSGSYISTDGFSAAASGIEPDGFDQLAISGSAFVDLTDTLEVFASGRYANADLDIDGFPAPAFALADTLETQETEQLSGAVGLNYYGQDLTLKASFALSDTARDNFDPAAGNAPTFASDGASQELTLRGEYRLIGGMVLAFGGNRLRSEYRTSFDAGNDATVTGAYLQIGGTLGPVAAHLGARIDDHDVFGSETSFGGDFSYRIGGDWRIKASAGEGFKPPSLFQLYSAFGNTALQPEKSTSYDLGIEHGERGRGFHAALTAWRRDSENLITFDLGTFAYANTARARAQGFELELGASPNDTLHFGAAYTLTDAQDRMTGNVLPRRPRHAVSLWGDWETGLLAQPDTAGLALGFDLRMAGDSFDDAGNFTSLDGYAVFDLRAEMPLTSAVELFGRVENLFDARYQTAAGYATAGRGAFVGVRASM